MSLKCGYIGGVSMVLEMMDGGIVDIKYDSYCDNWGCETCGYGSSYINAITIILTSRTLEITLDNEYEYAIEESFLIKYFASNAHLFTTFSEEQFVTYLKENFKEAIVRDLCPRNERDTDDWYEFCLKTHREGLKVSFSETP